MPFSKKTNLAKSKVATAPDPASSGTALVVTADDGAKFPALEEGEFFWATAWPPNVSATVENSEVVKVTARSTDTFTIERAQQGSSAKAIDVDWNIANTITIQDLIDIEEMSTGYAYNEVPGGTINGSNTSFTTANTYVSGSLRVFKNGVRMKGGGNDYTETAGGFTMVTAPATGTVLLVDYQLTSDILVSEGSINFITNEVPSGTVNGSNALFTLSAAYVAGSLMVYRDGQLMNGGGNDYTETSPVAGTFTFTTAPTTGSVILVSYRKGTSVGANADAVNSIQASDTAQEGKLFPFYGGWHKINQTITRSSVDATVRTAVFTITGDLTSLIYPGVKMKLDHLLNPEDSEYYDCCYICTVSSYNSGTNTTTITIFYNSDHFTTSAAQTSFWISYAKAPKNFPMDKDKWSLILNDDSLLTISNPAADTWVTSGLSLDVAIGLWRIYFQVAAEIVKAGTTTGELGVAVSTANNSASEKELWGTFSLEAANATLVGWNNMTKEKIKTLAAKTTLYVNIKATTASTMCYLRGDRGRTVLKAECAYL